MSYRVVSYYTQQTIYENIIVNYLMPSLTFYKIPHFIFSIPDLKNWQYNASLQPKIILDAMKTFPNDNIIWMDADIIIRENPVLFNQIPSRCDIGLNYLMCEEHLGIKSIDGHKPIPMLSTSVIYFKNSPKMISFVEEWMVKSANIQANHRKTLSQLVDQHLIDSLSFFMLPRTYAYLAEREDGFLPAVILKEPIICHFGMSRYGKNNLYDATPLFGE